MSKDTILKLEIELLIARYGKRKVQDALAAIQDTGSTDLGGKQGIDIKAQQKKRRQGKELGELVRDADPSNEEAKQVLEKLAHRYESKEFLPQLRQVKRFLESEGIPSANLRSRTDGLPKVISALARHSNDQLHNLLEDVAYDRSDLGIITDQILGRDKRG